MNELQKKLVEKIKNGEVAMVPRWHFVLKGVLWFAAVLLTLLVAVYLLSFILFGLHSTGVLFAPLFGMRGLMIFIVSSPWLLIGVLFLFLGVLYVLVSRYSFSYKKPLVYSMIGVVLMVVAVGSLIEQTKMHDRIGAFASERGVPGLAPLYRQFDDRAPKNVTLGTVAAVAENEFTLETRNGEAVFVHVYPHTKLHRDQQVRVGDVVMVFGKREGDVVDAVGVRSADDQFMPPKPRFKNERLIGE